MSVPNKLWYIVRYLPWDFRRSLLQALAWPAYKVTRTMIERDPGAPGGYRVDDVPLDVAAQMEADARALCALGPERLTNTAPGDAR